MSESINIQFEEVYSGASSLNRQSCAARSSMQEAYARVAPLLSETDGGANAALTETMSENEKKAILADDTLKKLLSFMEKSARQAEAIDLLLAGIFGAADGGKS